MLRYRLFACLSVALPAWLSLACPISAAPPPPTPAAADPLKAGFEALPDEQRRALQDALVWTGDFNGAVAGSYGPRTRDALLAHAKRIGLPPEAALTAAARTRLLTAAASARTNVGFATLRDAQAGFAFGLPLALVPVRTSLPDGTRYAAPDASVVVDTTGRAAGPEALDETLARLTRDAPGRHVSYKLAKPDFIVVSGEVGDRKFYSRYAFGTPAGGASMLRGFTLTYPGVYPEMDRIALAVAASFDAFPPPAPAPPPQVATAPVAPIPLPAPASVLAGQAVLVASGLALTRTDPTRCRQAEVDGVRVTWLRQDAETGLALLALPGHRDATPVRLSTAGAEAQRLVLFLAPGKSAQTLSAGPATPAGASRIRAPLQGAEAGVVLIDSAGDLAGIVGPSDSKAVAVSGVVTAARYDVVEGGRLADFLKAASVPVASGPSFTSGSALARWGSVVLPLRCQG